MHAARLLIVFAAVVVGPLGCDHCPTPDVHGDAAVGALPPFADAADVPSVCAAACSPNKVYGACIVQVSPTWTPDGGALNGPPATVSCVGQDDAGYALEYNASLSGDWPSLCTQRCGFSGWGTCVIFASTNNVSCLKRGCNSGS